MLKRRTLVASGAAAISVPARAEESFDAFLNGVRAEARRAGIPVFYTALWEAAQDGTPILRPLALVHPEDETIARTSPDGFYLGGSLLAQPVLVEGQTEREVYLPASPTVRPITATLVRQIAGMGGDVSAFVPATIAARLKTKFAR